MTHSFIPLTRPTLPKAEHLLKKIQEVFNSGMITEGKYVKELEEACARRLGVKYAVATSNGTSALLLSLQCLDLKGEVILPSFTYSSGGHVLLWSSLKPVFADIDGRTFNIDPAAVEKKITPKTCAIMPTHVFGNPCDVLKLSSIARHNNLKIIYDGAHAFGSLFQGQSLAAFGDATIYSFTPTKVFTTGEGGLVATNNKRLADRLRVAKLNGDTFQRDQEFLGYTARMSELQAILGLEALKPFDSMVKKRLQHVADYKQLLSGLKGFSFQEVGPEHFSVYKDFTILVDPKQCGFSRNALIAHLQKKEIQTKVYFDPPLHRKKVYSADGKVDLPVTEFISQRIMNLPLYSHMPKAQVERVCHEITSLYSKSKKQ